MAVHLPLHFPITSLPHPQFRKLNKPTLKPFLKPHIPNPLKFTTSATSSSSSSEKEKEKEDKPTNPEEVSDIGSEIKKAMEEREKVREEGGFWDGVAKEAKEIEWPAFGKVVGTTGVVLGVIAGSSVVLLTLNAVLAELSDKVFAGRGVQDFFG